ncbi:MAG: phage tail tape measure protein [Dehalococcoidales bacterium]
MTENSTGVQVMQKLELDYSQAITATMLLSREVQALDNQLRGLHITALSMASKGVAGSPFMGAQQLAQNKVIYDQYGRTLSVIGDNTVAVAKKTDTATKAAQKHKQSVNDVAKSYNVLGSQFERRLSWLVTGAGMFGAVHAAQALVKTVKDVEFGMTEIARVTEDANFNFAYMRDELQDLGVQYGATWNTLHDISLKWAQAGYNQAETIKLTRTALLALNTAELDSQYATAGMIAIMAQWGLTAEQLLPTLDKINKVADDYAITSQDLVDGLNRSGGAARAMGMSLNDTIALLTVMRESTGRTGKEVGNALNSIISFVQRKKSLKIFSELGIGVFADEARTKFRPVIDILADMSTQYEKASEASQKMFDEAARDAGLYSEEMAEVVGATEEWNDLQKSEAAGAASGIYRRSYLLALLNNFSKVYKVLQTQEESLGYSMRENERTMATLEKQWISLKAATEQLAVAIGEAGLLDNVKELVIGTREAVEWFNELPPAMQEVIIKAVGAITMFTLLNSTMKMLGVGSIGQVLVGLTNIASSLGLVNASALTAGGALRILATNPFTIAIGATIGATVAIKKYLDYLDMLPERVQRSIQSHQDAASVARSQKEQIEKLRDEYIALSQEGELSAEKSERLKQVVDELRMLVPEAVVGFDNMGDAITDLGTVSRATADEIQRLNDLIREEARLAAEEARLNLPDLQESRKKLEKQRQKEEEQVGRLQAQTKVKSYIPGYIERHKPGWIEDARKDLIEIDKKMVEIDQAINEANRAIAMGEIAQSKPTTGGAKGGAGKPAGYTGPPSSSGQGEQLKKLGAIIDEFINQTLRLVEAESSLNRSTQRVIDGKEAMIQYYTREGASAEERAKAYQAEIELLEEYQKKQNGVHLEADAVRAAKSALIAKQNTLNLSTEAGAEAYAKLADEIENLSDQESQLGVEWWQLQDRITGITTASRKMTDAFDQGSRAIQHWSAMGVMSTEQQINALRKLATVKSMTIDEMWQMDERYHGLYMDLINEEYQALEKSYRDRIKQIEDEAKTRIESIQEQIDALNRQGEAEDREEAEAQHNQKMLDLQEELQYHKLRTGREHEEAIIDIQRQIEDEQRRWEQQQADWEREDRIDDLNQRIDDIEEAAEKEKEEWEEAWADIQDAFSEHNKNLIAAAAAASDEWYNQWKAKIDQLKIDLASGMPSDAGSTVGGIGTPPPVHDYGMSDADYNEFINNGLLWQEANERGDTAEMDRLHKLNDELRAKYGIPPDEYPKFHAGAKTLSYGMAEFAPGELVFPADLSVKLERLIHALTYLPRDAISGIRMPPADKRLHIAGHLFNAEKVVMGDKLDVKIVARELKRAVALVQ